MGDVVEFKRPEPKYPPEVMTDAMSNPYDIYSADPEFDHLQAVLMQIFTMGDDPI